MAITNTSWLKVWARRIRYQWKKISEPSLLTGIQLQRNTVKLGSEYGGYTVCPDGINKGSIVYSLGIGEDVSFDLGMILHFGCEVFAFDPTPKTIAWLKKQELPKSFHFSDLAIADFDGVASFYPPKNQEFVSHSLAYRQGSHGKAFQVRVRRLPSVMEQLGHARIDLLKIDVEGAEYSILRDLAKSEVEVSQIVVEFHRERYQSGLTKIEAIKLLNSLGFRVFAVQLNEDQYSLIKYQPN